MPKKQPVPPPSSPTEVTEDSDIPSSSVLIDLWLETCSEESRRSIGITGEESYRYFWNTWNKYLTTADLGGHADDHRWRLATGTTILHFLNSGTTPRKRDEGVSAITRRRYWRLLERIYDFAMAKGWIDHNPAQAIQEWEKPRSENPKGAILSNQQWQKGIELLQSENEETRPKPRNLAILMCLYELGITPLELRSLTLDALQSDSSGKRFTYLQIDGEGINQRRRFAISPVLAKAMASWMTERAEMPKAGNTDHLFCSTHGKMMGPDNLHLLVREHLLQAAAVSESDPAVRLGPQVIRNTRLVQWVNQGIPLAQVAVLAGLKNEKGLYHLADHFNRELDPGSVSAQ